jgi:hypothetical protein
MEASVSDTMSIVRFHVWVSIWVAEFGDAIRQKVVIVVDTPQAYASHHVHISCMKSVLQHQPDVARDSTAIDALSTFIK